MMMNHEEFAARVAKIAADFATSDPGTTLAKINATIERLRADNPAKAEASESHRLKIARSAKQTLLSSFEIAIDEHLGLAPVAAPSAAPAQALVNPFA